MVSGQRVRMPAMAKPRVWPWLRAGRAQEVQELLGLVGPVDFDAPRRMQCCRIQRAGRRRGQEEGTWLPKVGGVAEGVGSEEQGVGGWRSVGSEGE